LFQGALAWAPNQPLPMSQLEDKYSVDEKIDLITRRLAEVMGGEEIIKKMRSIVQERSLRIYWGTATTGQPHVGYFVPMSKIADFLRAGCEVTILFADLHAYLDNMKSTWELLALRVKYYEAIIKAMLESINVPITKLKFVQGTSFELTTKYTLDVYRLSSITTVRNAKKAGAEVVKQVESPLLSGLLYPLLQALDEEYLDVDAQFGGIDQRKIFTLCEEYLPKIEYKKRIHLMNPMVPGLQRDQGGKMSSSDRKSKIDLLDSEEEIKMKVMDAFAEPGNITENGLLAFIKMVLFPLQKGPLVVKRLPKHGGDISFNTYQELETAYATQKLYPLDLKATVFELLNKLLAPIRQRFTDPDLIELTRKAYPVERSTWQGPNTAPVTQIPAESKKAKGDKVASGKEAKGSGAKSSGTKPGQEKEIAKLEIRVGRIVEAKHHPTAANLLVEEIDLGEGKSRPVVSALRQFYQPDELKDKLVCVIVNLKPTKFVGAPSDGLLLVATSSDKAKVEVLEAPAGAAVGERVTFDGFPTDSVPPRANPKVLKELMGLMTINDKGVAQYKDTKFNTSKGPVKVNTLTNASVA